MFTEIVTNLQCNCIITVILNKSVGCKSRLLYLICCFLKYCVLHTNLSNKISQNCLTLHAECSEGDLTEFATNK
jgi:hypothetical protein